MTISVDLSGRRILVTGASSGIGAEISRSLVCHGAMVTMLARRKDRLDELQRELGDQATGIACDVTDLSALQAAIAEATDTMGGLDSIVAVAGRAMVGSIDSGEPERWRDLMTLNLIAPLATVRYAIEHFPRNGRKDVILIGSTGGITPMPGVGIYGASKQGLRGAFDALRLELAPSGINVSLIMPGMFETEGLVGAVEFNGSMPSSEMPMFTKNGGPASPPSLADTTAFMMGMPEGVCINELVIRPTGQLNP